MSVINATRSEVTKHFTTAMWWILGLITFVYVGAVAAGVAGVGSLMSDSPLPLGDSVSDTVYSVATSIGYVFPLLIGTLLVTSEFRHMTLTPTFLATPRRGTALTGKVIAGVVIGAIYAVIALAASVGLGALVLVLTDQPLGLDSPDTWALLGRILLAFILWTLIGVGAGALVRNQVAAVVGVLAFTQLIEPIARTAGMFVDGLSTVVTYLPGAASDALVGASIMNVSLGAASTPGLEWWQGGAVLLAYAVVLVVLGYIASWRRDVS